MVLAMSTARDGSEKSCCKFCRNRKKFIYGLHITSRVFMGHFYQLITNQARLHGLDYSSSSALNSLHLVLFNSDGLKSLLILSQF